jgi:2-dehydro-3-deoxyphosphogluconate aldolase / (4S)-4-hydroxy-2-oxoglutarate aldolase
VRTVSQVGLAEHLARAPVVPVIVVNRLDHAVPLARALVEGGLTLLEITLRTAVALDALRAIRAEVPGAVCGVGTVLRPEQLTDAARAGAAFAVSPGATERLLDAAADSPVPLLPGAATASEVLALLERGVTLQKFFPAEPAGGAAYLSSLASPIPEVRFCPTGGVHPGNAAAYLALPNVVCVGGSWMMPKAAVEAGDWATVTRLAREAAGLR